MANCETCRYYRPTTVSGTIIPCSLYVHAPVDCPDFTPMPPVELCRQCEHARFDYADRPPFCQKHVTRFEDGDCSAFERRRPADLPSCPKCGEALEIAGRSISCPNGHRWKLRQSSAICPRCGQRYTTFGQDQGHQRVVYRVCTNPACRWSRRVYRRNRGMGPVGRGRHGGQRWSPVTGRGLG